MEKKKYKWIVAEKPPSLVYRRRKEYDECIQEFLESNFKSARVNISRVKPQSLYLTLLKRITQKGLRNKIRVCVRKGKVFLVRIE